MATVNYTTAYVLTARAVKVEWMGLGNGDVGQPFDAAGLRLFSVQAWGGTGDLRIQVSNEATPANFITAESVSSIPRAAELDAGQWGAVRPLFEGTGSANVAMLFAIL